MAEMLISGVVKTLMGTLSSLLQQEFVIAWGLKKELEKLESTLTTIQTVLKDAEAKKGKNEELKNWLRKLKDAAYEADDMIDEFKIEALQWKAAGTLKKVHKFFSRSNALAFSIEMGHKIQEIRDKLDAIAAERSKFHLRDEVGGNRIENEERLVTDSFIIESGIYGREDEKEVIVKSLVSNMSEPENVSILPIVGMGGLGKTTLAQLAYNDERIMKHFEQRIWVCVSDSFELRRLMDAIIESVCGKVSGYVELDPLQRRLRETLRGKRFLLVLDDVWSEDQDKWDRLKSILTCGGKGSTIIVTTRIEKVAWMTGTLPTFHLACLSDDDCWSLFKRRAFELGRREEHPNLVAIGKEIVKKCGGVPLAVKALGSMLCYKSEERDWLYVKDSEIWELSDDDSAILPALRLSYDHLPPHSRQCFAYCAIFPKDYEIEKEKLIHQWMGNGFIPSKRMMVLEDVGHEIFNDLVCRSFFQNIGKDEDGNITKCKMHDLVHDLAQSVMVDDSSILIFGKEERIPEKVRHFSYDRESTIPMSLYDSPTLWTFLTLHDYQRGIIAVSHHMSKFKHLRVLELTHARVRNLSPLIGNLKHLRLPKKMRKMNNLTHLDNAHNTSLNCMPRRMGQLTQLQTLKLFIVGKKNGYRIGELHNLNLRGELNIKHLNCVRDAKDAEGAKLISKPNLCSLGLSWNYAVEDKMQENLDEVLKGLRPHPNLKQLLIDNYHGLVFPSWMRDTTLQNLVRLSLIDCTRSENLPPLGKLPSLKNLKIHEMDAIKFIGTGFYGDDETMKAFPSLKELEFYDMPNWEEWSRSEGRELFPQLQILTIDRCSKLTNMPCIASLQDLKLESSDPAILMSVSSLTLLSSLHISDFDQLTSFPVGMLENSTNLVSLYVGCLPKLMSLHRELDNLVALKSLCIVSCNDLASLPEGLKNLTSLERLEISICESLLSLPEEGLLGMTSLCDLSINSCDKLTSLSGLQYLTALETMSITGCKEVAMLPNGMENLRMLRMLSIHGLPNLVSLPDGLQQATSLQGLNLGGCKSLVGLPEWIENLISLRSLRIWHCPNIAILPAGLKRRAPLLELKIEDCPQLK
ncbi:hypothetical protein AAC387_Pa03g1014 [Persea americana]